MDKMDMVSVARRQHWQQQWRLGRSAAVWHNHQHQQPPQLVSVLRSSSISISTRLVVAASQSLRQQAQLWMRRQQQQQHQEAVAQSGWRVLAVQHRS